MSILAGPQKKLNTEKEQD